MKNPHYDIACRACALASMMLMNERFWYHLALFSLRDIEFRKVVAFFG